MSQISKKEQRFLSRICVRLYKHPNRWRELMEEQGLSLDQVTTHLINETKAQKERTNEIITIIPTKD